MFGDADHAAPRSPLSVESTQMLGPDADGMRVVVAGEFAGDEVHLRRADEAGDEEIVRLVIELERRADLLDVAGD